MFEFGDIYFREKNDYLTVAGVSEKIQPDIVIPNEINNKPIKEIEPYAFQNVEELESISFVGNISIIREKAFYNCKNLKVVCFLSPNNQTVKIQEQAFAHCESLYTINGDIDIVLCGEYVFHNCKSMVKMPMQISGDIPFGTFSGCTNLTVLLFQNVLYVNTAAFLDCKNVKKIFVFKDFNHTNDFWDGWEHVEIICSPKSKFAEFAYTGYNVTCLKAKDMLI